MITENPQKGQVAPCRAREERTARALYGSLAVREGCLGESLDTDRLRRGHACSRMAEHHGFDGPHSLPERGACSLGAPLFSTMDQNSSASPLS